MKIEPYLNFNGQCAEAFRYYEKVFNGRIESIMTNGESPAASEIPAELHDRVMHARLAVGDTIVMASDSPPEYYEQPKGLWVSVQIEDPSEAERVFHALSEGGSVTMAIEETFWAKRFGMLTDRWGIPWMINCSRGPSQES